MAVYASSTSVTGVKLGGSAGNFAAVYTDTTTASAIALWADPNCAGGQTSVAVTMGSTTGSVFMAVIAYEFSGLALSSVTDKTQNHNVQGGAATFTSNATATTTQAAELWFGLAAGYNNAGAAFTFTGPASPWANVQQNGGTDATSLIAGYQIVSSAGTVTYSGTASTTDSNLYFASIASSFKAAGGTNATVTPAALTSPASVLAPAASVPVTLTNSFETITPSGTTLTAGPSGNTGSSVSATATPARLSDSSSVRAVTVSTTGGALVPVGVPGTWAISFDDEFPGSAVDTSKWYVSVGDSMNNVTTSASNVWVTGGYLYIQLSSSSSGGMIVSQPYAFPVGSCIEARVKFAGSGTNIYNWPAWWVSGPSWPAAGEIDIAEGAQAGNLTINYHSPSGAHNGPDPGPSGTWAGGFHTYSVVRNSNSFNTYYDGVNVYNYSPTDDNGAAQQVLLNVGSYGTVYTGASSYLVCDYVRAWTPA